MSGPYQTKSEQTAGYTLYHKWRWRGFGYRSDLISHDYMRRWVLETPWFLIRLHHIMRSDNDRHFHDHPFSFISLILSGGYIEHAPESLPRMFKPGSVVKKKSTDLHYLKLLDGPAWTLVFTTPYHRGWGFATEEGWIPADKYDAWLATRDAREKAETTPIALTEKV